MFSKNDRDLSQKKRPQTSTKSIDIKSHPFLKRSNSAAQGKDFKFKIGATQKG